MSVKFKAKKDYLKRDLGHWKYCGEDKDISKCFGFVYLVVNEDKHKFYIGKKQFWTYKKNTHTKTGKAFWRTYTTSSAHVKKDLKAGDNMSFHILGVFNTRAWCNYSEAWLQMVLCAITDRDSSGERKWYNNQVAAIRFIPKDDPEQHDEMHEASGRAQELLSIYGDLDVKN